MKGLQVAVSLLTTALVLSCNQEEETAADPEPTGPPAVVNLPPVPNIDVNRPVRYPDGALSIWGILQRREESMNQSVVVLGYVREIYICETRAEWELYQDLVRNGDLPNDEGSGEAIACNYPHLLIADNLTADIDLLITGYRQELEQHLLVCERYRFEGRYMDETRGFNRAGVGLIYTTNISGGNLDPLEVGAEGNQGVRVR
jgi:hypothetical protein